MAWRKRQDPEPVVIPGWIRHECDGGFTAAAWAEPGDFGADPRVAESRARGRWMAARNAWLAERPGVAGLLLEQLRQMADEVP